MAFHFGDVLLVPIAFSEGTGAKRRPVLTIYDFGDADLLVVPVTSHLPRSVEDIRLQDWRAAGLRLPSTARMSKLATVAKATIVRNLGRLSEHDTLRARHILQQFLARIL